MMKRWSVMKVKIEDAENPEAEELTRGGGGREG